VNEAALQKTLVSTDRSRFLPGFARKKSALGVREPPGRSDLSCRNNGVKQPSEELIALLRLLEPDDAGDGG
jgi:hypothetical protein